MSKTCVIFHDCDLDGWMSGAIVKHWFEQEKKRLEDREEVTMNFIGYNYGQPIPDLSEYDRVIMCDISFPKEEMYNLYSRLHDNFTWIDHHISAISDNIFINDNICKGHKYNGLRNTKFAACELTWEFFFPNKTIPEIVRLLGRYDCFGMKGTDEEQKVLEFQYGARQCISNYEEAYNALLQSFNRSELSETIEFEIHEKGKAIYQYLCTDAKQAYKNGFKIKLYEETSDCPIAKEREFICINKERFNPINFGIEYHSEGYDGAMCWHLGADKMVNISFYNDNGQVDCSTIAKLFGGGGHKGAAGCIMNIDDFKKLINNE